MGAAQGEELVDAHAKRRGCADGVGQHERGRPAGERFERAQSPINRPEQDR